MNLRVFIENAFDFSTLVMFLISAIILIFIDCKYFKEKGYERERKVSKVFGVLFIVIGVGMYVFTRYINV